MPCGRFPRPVEVGAAMVAMFNEVTVKAKAAPLEFAKALSDLK